MRYWRRPTGQDQHKDLTGTALADEVNKQSWDPSVKAMTQFPSVLGNMEQNLAWTSELGDAYINQRKELTSAVQTMRERAKKAGNLEDDPAGEGELEGQDDRDRARRHRCRLCAADRGKRETAIAICHAFAVQGNGSTTHRRTWSPRSRVPTGTP